MDLKIFKIIPNEDIRSFNMYSFGKQDNMFYMGNTSIYKI